MASDERGLTPVAMTINIVPVTPSPLVQDVTYSAFEARPIKFSDFRKKNNKHTFSPRAQCQL